MVEISKLKSRIQHQRENPERIRLDSTVQNYWDDLCEKVRGYFSKRSNDIKQLKFLERQKQALSKRLEYPDIDEKTLDVIFRAYEEGRLDTLDDGLKAKFRQISQHEEGTKELDELSERIESVKGTIASGVERKIVDVKIHPSYISMSAEVYPGYVHLGVISVYGKEKLASLVHGAFGKHQDISIFLRETPRLAELEKVSKRLGQLEREQLECVVDSALGGNFQATYLCPAWAPDHFSFRMRGTWKYVDKVVLDAPGHSIEIQNQFIKVNPRSSFVVFDVREQQLPPELPESSFDLVFYNSDYAEDGSTHRLAARLCKKDGLVITRLKNAEEIKRMVPVLCLLGSYPYFSYSTYTKL